MPRSTAFRSVPLGIAKKMIAIYNVFLRYEFSSKDENDAREFEERGSQTLEGIRDAFGTHNPAVLGFERRFARLVTDLDKKERLLFSNLDASRRTFGDEPVVAEAIYTWAKFLEEDMDRPGEAESSFKEAVRLLTVAFGDRPHWRVGQAHQRLGKFYMRQKNDTAATKEFRKAIDIFKATETLQYSKLGKQCQRDLARVDADMPDR